MKLVIVSGASGALGAAYLDYFKSAADTKCIAITRSELKYSTENISVIHADLLKGQEVESAIAHIDLQKVTSVLFIHPVGKFKFEESGKPELDKNNDGIDDEVYVSNVATFFNIAQPLILKLGAEAQLNRLIQLTLCAFGSVSDKYKVPFWQSYTKSKKSS